MSKNKIIITFEITENDYTEEVKFKGKTYKTKNERTEFGAQGITTDLDSQGCPYFIQEDIGNPYMLMKELRNIKKKKQNESL